MIKKKKNYLVVVRHGESFANVTLKEESDGLHYSLAGSDASIGLTERGKQQASTAAQRLRSLFPRSLRFKRVYQNRFERVRQTASILLQYLRYPTEICEDVRLEKRSYGEFWNLTYRGVRELHPEEYELFLKEGAIDYRPPGGENYLDLFHRVEQFANEKLQVNGNQLIVTSSSVMLTFRRLFAGLPDQSLVDMYENLDIANGSIDVYVRDHKTGWKLLVSYDSEETQAS